MLFIGLQLSLIPNNLIRVKMASIFECLSLLRLQTVSNRAVSNGRALIEGFYLRCLLRLKLFKLDDLDEKSKFVFHSKLEWSVRPFAMLFVGLLACSRTEHFGYRLHSSPFDGVPS